LFALFSGALVDRLDRRVTIVAADTFRAVVLGALGISVLAGGSPLWAVYLTLFLMGSAETPGNGSGSPMRSSGC
jgi:MFS family permease